ncbi:MAG: amidase family protein [Rhodospirillales bacterium]
MELINRSACDVVDGLRSGELTPDDLLDALEARIAAVDDKVHALPTLCFDRARAAAARRKGTPATEGDLLCGLPVPVKDLSEVSGVRTTFGSPIFKDFVPDFSAHIVERIEASGGIVYAKSNTPEFGAGAQTFNEVFPATRNPWNLGMSAAGSSGGAAAALASGLAWLAHGSDMGGSLRNPASFCGVVGLRPSPGRVPCGSGSDSFANLAVEGPMARDVDDVALCLDAMCGLEPREPLSLEAPPDSFRAAAAERRPPKRVAYSADLGITPVDPEVAAITGRAVRAFETAGAEVIDAHPDMSEAHDVFQVLRAHDFAVGLGDAYRHQRGLLKPEVVWNIEQGLNLSADDIATAIKRRGELVTRAMTFMGDVDILATPATIVPAFPVEWRYLEECAGTRFDTYIDWLAIVYAITLTGLPAISIPCGFTKAGLPVGLQLVGRPRGEAALLSAAGVIQDLLGLPCTPIDPKE